MATSAALPVRVRIGGLAECEVGTIDLDAVDTHADLAGHLADLLELAAARIRTWPSIRAEAKGTPPGDALPPG
jgi:hypothetical protein